jgi:hypothetical protein
MSRINIMDAVAIPAAGMNTATVVTGYDDAAYLLMQAKFVYGSGGTSVKAYVQTSLDGGATWIDVASFAFTTASATKLSKVLAVSSLTAVTVPTDGSLTDNTVLDGVIGDRLRVKYVVVGTYAASTLTVSVEAK